MFSTLRKIFVGLIAFALVAGAFILYNKLNRTPRIDLNAVEHPNIPADSNAGTGAGVGTIGDVGLGNVGRAVFFHRDTDRKIDREFGFRKLLHKVRDRLEIEGPYMKVYQRNFDCVITADRGNVDVQTAANTPSPGDASFTGNVVIHLVPRPGSDFKESFVYLDDVIFVSDKSLFSTAGPVRFLSDDAEMLGRGMELVYNDEKERLEFFKIVNLQSMKMRSTDSRLVPEATSEPNGTGAGAVAETAAETTTNTASDANVAKAVGEPNGPSAAGDYYQCVLADNVKIDAPDQLILARERLVIHDIFWARSKDKEETDANSPMDFNAPAVAPEPPSNPTPPVPPVAEANAVSPPQLDVTITCDGGILLAPVDSILMDKLMTEPNLGSDKPFDESIVAKAGLRTVFLSNRIDHSMQTRDTVARGLSHLTFYTDANSTDPNSKKTPVTIIAHRETRFVADSNNVIFDGNCVCVMSGTDPNARKGSYTLKCPTITVDLPEDSNEPFASADVLASGPVKLDFFADNPSDANKPPLPVNVLAQKNARVVSADNQVIFDGDCVCTMLQDDPNQLQKYVLTAPRITIDMLARGETSGGDFKNLTAGGGQVMLATVKKTKPQMVDMGGMELKCGRFDFDPNDQLFTAIGPGILQIDNSKLPEPNVPGAGMSLSKPCYAFLREFATLKYYVNENRIIADATPDSSLRIDYLPINKGVQDQHVVARVGHVEALMQKLATGQNELAMLHGTGGVTYEDEKNQFDGSELTYDYAKQILKVTGDRTRPCYFNGALVKSIVYDLKTGRVSTETAGPGMIQMK